MLLIAGVASLVTAGALIGSDVTALEQVWSGVHDSSEQVIVGSEPGPSAWSDNSERRLRTVVAPVKVPWLGAHILYLEEFPHDDPEGVRRQLLLELEPAPPPMSGVHVRVYGFVKPLAWAHLSRRPKLLASLQRSQIAHIKGCDWHLSREGDQFRGGTQGRGCVDGRATVTRYVDYQLVLGEDLYWYRRRVLRKTDDELLEEVVGFNWFELNEARLFACDVVWSATGKLSDLRPLLHLDLHDQGGRARFRTPDGRRLELTLHSQDWPFAADRDALILLLRDEDEGALLASSWDEIDSPEIELDLGWLQVHCGSIVPDTDEMWSGLPGSTPRAGAQQVDVAQQKGIEALGHFHHEEVIGVVEHDRLERGHRFANARLVGRRQIGVDREDRHVDVGQEGREVDAQQRLQRRHPHLRRLEGHVVGDLLHE